MKRGGAECKSDVASGTEGIEDKWPFPVQCERRVWHKVSEYQRTCKQIRIWNEPRALAMPFYRSYTHHCAVAMSLLVLDDNVVHAADLSKVKGEGKRGKLQGKTDQLQFFFRPSTPQTLTSPSSAARPPLPPLSLPQRIGEGPERPP